MVALLPTTTVDEYTVYWRGNHSTDVSCAFVVRGLQGLEDTRTSNDRLRIAARSGESEDSSVPQKSSTCFSGEFSTSRRNRPPRACSEYACSSAQGGSSRPPSLKPTTERCCRSRCYTRVRTGRLQKLRPSYHFEVISEFLSPALASPIHAWRRRHLE